MRWKLLVLLVVTAALAVPAVALADDAPSPAAAACKAEYMQLGADAFKARYGASDPYRACLKAHGETAPPATPTAPAAPTGPEAACKAEYLQLGADAFKAKYGSTETFGACVRAHGGTSNPPTTTKPQQPAPTSGPAAACIAEYTQLGAAAFKAKYGATEPYGACLKAHGGAANTQPTTTTNPAPASGPAAACIAEYTQLGAAAFKAKYGATEPYGACLKAHGAPAGGSGDKPKTEPKSVDPAAAASYFARALCVAEAQALGTTAFQAKYGQGKAGLAACVSASLPRAESIVASCKTSTGGDAFKQCMLAALKGAGAR